MSKGIEAVVRDIGGHSCPGCASEEGSFRTKRLTHVKRMVIGEHITGPTCDSDRIFPAVDIPLDKLPLEKPS